MKKLAISFTIIVSLLVLLLIGVPVIFKNPILEKTKTTINKQVNAKVTFSDLKLSVFKAFPKVSLQLTDVVVSGTGQFKNDTLLAIPKVESKIALLSLFSGRGITIQKIALFDPGLFLKVAEDGTANWDIAKGEKEGLPAEEEKPKVLEARAGSNEFEVQLEEVVINNAHVTYDDKPTQFFMDFAGSDFTLNGKMYESNADINSTGSVREFALEHGGEAYISNTRLQANSVLSINYETMDIHLGENELLINEFPMDVSGDIKMPDESILFNLAFQSKTSGLENLLALVPPMYAPYMEGIETTGGASLNGYFKGVYLGEDYPGLDVNLNIENGSFKYKSLPEEIKNIGAVLKISKPQGDLDLASVELKNAHAELKGNPVDLGFKLSKLMSDMQFDGALNGMVDFGQLKDALPLDSLDMVGIMDADVAVKGTYAAIKNGDYSQIVSKGAMTLKGISVKSPGLRQTIHIPAGGLAFSPQKINLSNFQMKIGQSDMQLKGAVSNYLEYLFNGGDLKGHLQLNSGFLNLNELLALQIQKEKPLPEDIAGSDSDAPENKGEMLVFDVPERMDMAFTSNVKTALLDKLPISNIRGLVTVKGEKLNLNGLKMDMLDGGLELTGSYQNNENNAPFFDFGFDIKDFDLPTAYRTLSGIRKIMPMAGNSTGSLSSKFNMKGQLSPALKIIAPTIDGMGIFSTKNLEIKDSPIFSQIKGVLKKEMLDNVAIDDFTANFKVEKGNLLLKPFKTKIAGQDATIKGSLSATSLLNMEMGFVVQREAFGADIQSILAVLPGQERIKTVPATVKVKGPVGGPKVSLELEDARKQIMDEIKRSSADDLKKSLERLGKGLQKLFK